MGSLNFFKNRPLEDAEVVHWSYSDGFFVGIQIFRGRRELNIPKKITEKLHFFYFRIIIIRIIK